MDLAMGGASFSRTGAQLTYRGVRVMFVSSNKIARMYFIFVIRPRSRLSKAIPELIQSNVNTLAL